VARYGFVWQDAFSTVSKLRFTNPKLLFLFVGLLAHFLVLKEYFFRMWSLAHYQFFPLALAAAIWLFFDRKDEIFTSSTPPNQSVQSGLMLVIVTMVSLATLINSSFIGWISFVLFVATTIYSCVGGEGLKRSLPVLIVLSLITPLPAQLDQDLILKMQYLASGLASWVLDTAGILHLRQGVVLVSETNQFLAEEACSGIRSLFSATAAIVFWGLLQRYAWWRNLINCVQTIGWVLVGNAVRIAVVVLVEDKTAFSVSTGWQHEFLGVTTFFMIFGLALSFDRLVRIFIPIKSQGSGRRGQRAEVQVQALAGANVGSLEMPHAKYWMVVFGLIGLLALRLSMTTIGTPISGSLTSLDFPKQSDLSSRLQSWNVSEFQHINRSREDIQGEDSFIWVLKNGSRSAQLSMDCQWSDFHDLSYCYTGLGWRVETEHRYQGLFGNHDAAPGEQINYSRLQLSKPTGERGIVLFCGLDQTGKEVQPQLKLGQNTLIHIREKMINSLRVACGLAPLKSIRNSTFKPPVTTVQLVCVPQGPIDAKLMQDLESVFFAAREQFKKSVRFTPKSLTGLELVHGQDLH